MATRDEVLRIRFQVDDAGQVQAEILGAKRAFSEAGAAAIEMNQALELASRAFEFLAEPARKAIDFLRESVDAASRQDVAIKQLNAALLSTGESSAAYSAALVDLASKYERLSTADDAALLDTEKLLVSFGAAPNQIQPLLKGVLDLSAGLGIDLPAATKLVDAALTGHGERLARYGITIDSTAPRVDQLRQLLEQLQVRFGGQAVAEIDTYSGSVHLAGVAWEDLQKAVGHAITENPEVRAFFSAITEVLDELTRKLEDNRGEFQRFVSDGVRLFVIGIDDAIHVVQKFASALDLAFVPLTAFRAAMGQSLTPHGDELAVLAQSADDFRASFERAAASLQQKATEEQKNLGDVSASAKDAALSIDQVGGSIARLPSEKKISIDVVYQELFGGGSSRPPSSGAGGGSAPGPRYAGGGLAAGAAAYDSRSFVGDGSFLDPAVERARRIIASDIASGAPFALTPEQAAGLSSGSVTSLSAGPGPIPGAYTSDSFGAPAGLTIGGIGIPLTPGSLSTRGNDLYGLPPVDGSAILAPAQAFLDANPLDAQLNLAGSPSLPFTDYLTGYAPGVLKTFAASVPTLTFPVRIADSIGFDPQAAVKAFGINAAKFQPAYDLVNAGGAADPGEIRSMLVALKRESASYRTLNAKLTAAGAFVGPAFETFNYGGNVGPENNFSYQGAKVDSLIRTLEMRLASIESAQNNAQREQARAASGMFAMMQRTALAAERLAAGGVLSASNVALGVETAVKAAIGYRGVLFTSGRG